jgi:hypothetical protein
MTRLVCFNDWLSAGLPDDFDVFIRWVLYGPKELPRANS